MDVKVLYATDEHLSYAEAICELIASAAKARGTGIAKREPDYVRSKMKKGNAVIALSKTGDLAGFCYMEVWSDKEYLANSGLVVHPDFRHLGLAKKIKKKINQLSKDKYPNAKIFGITTSSAVLKINYELGYRPVTFDQLPKDEQFWKGCQSCPNHDILERNERKHCLCTGMLVDADSKFKVKEKNLIERGLDKIKKIRNKDKNQ